MRPLRLVWVFPDLLSTYGDRGNVLVLERRARLRGIPVEIIDINSDQQVARDGDIYLMGGGADLDPGLNVGRLTGFENHQGVTRLGPTVRPLARTSLGTGNGDGTEGAYAGRADRCRAPGPLPPFPP